MSNVAKVSEPPSLRFVIGAAIFAGGCIGAFYFSALATSGRTLLAGIAACVAFALMVGIPSSRSRRPSTNMLWAIWCVSGSTAGLTWWAVARPVGLGAFGCSLVGLGFACLTLMTHRRIYEKTSKRA
jgi:hypothetical protein